MKGAVESHFTSPKHHRSETGPSRWHWPSVGHSFAYHPAPHCYVILCRILFCIHLWKLSKCPFRMIRRWVSCSKAPQFAVTASTCYSAHLVTDALHTDCCRCYYECNCFLSTLKAAATTKYLTHYAPNLSVVELQQLVAFIEIQLLHKHVFNSLVYVRANGPDTDFTRHLQKTEISWRGNRSSSIQTRRHRHDAPWTDILMRVQRFIDECPHEHNYYNDTNYDEYEND